MTDRTDLTRWNRAGLRRFRYIEGNAARYLEELRDALAERFPQWREVGSSPTADEALWRERMLLQYFGERRDWAWEILRSFARAAHVLTEYLDAYANEGYLETATQWDNVRRLVEMLDYAPAPPASAYTPLALEALAGMRGVVAKGLQVKYTPPDGAAPVVFETLEDLAVDDRLNALRLAGWDRSPDPFDPYAGGATASPWPAGPSGKLAVGQPAILLQLPEVPPPGAEQAGLLPKDLKPCARAVEIASLTETAIGIVKHHAAAETADTVPWYRGYTRLLVAPKKVLKPRLNGVEVIELDGPTALRQGEVVAWTEANAWRFAGVNAAQGARLSLAPTPPPASVFLYRTARLLTQGEPAEYRVSSPSAIKAAAFRKADGSFKPVDLQKDLTPVPAAQDPKIINYWRLTPAGELYILSLNAASAPVGRVVMVGAPPAIYAFDGKAAELTTGDWLVAEGVDNAGYTIAKPVCIARIDQREDGYLLTLSPYPESSAGPVSSELLENLRRVEMALDQPVFAGLRLADLVSGKAAALPVSAIQGIGRGADSYSKRLEKQGIHTLGELAGVNPATSSAIEPTRLREFITKARLVTRFKADSGVIGPLLDRPLPELLALPTVCDPQIARLDRLHGPFATTLRPSGWDRNPHPVTLGELALALAPEQVPTELRPGRHLLLEQESAARRARLVQVAQLSSDPSSGRVTLTLSEKLDEREGFTYGNTQIQGNVVTAGHGERKGERILGSGDAAALNQEFLLDVPGIAFVTDSTMPAGVRADIELSVDDQIWQPVASLRDSGPTDLHYTVRMTEEGFLRIGCGDGRSGRRLPTGTNNVRATVRVGSGLAGNLSPGSLDTLARPHRLIAGVSQPLPAVGGNDMEDVASLRQNAPASLLTLERAVSLEDFANLAVSQAGVWQAAAFLRPTTLRRQGSVEVVIVPAGGLELDQNLVPIVPPQLLQPYATFLQTHALPGVEVTVRAYEPMLIDLEITVRVKSAEYDPQQTKERVDAALRQALGLRRRRLGQALYQSELYRIVEEVRGVENSDCWLRRRGQKERAGAVVPGDRQVVYLDPTYSTLVLRTEEFTL
ncbi:MAG: baseplate J/gp47 family protein [Candidatus Competibacteraceae bacterium]